MTWLMDGRTLARKVKNSSWKQGSSHQNNIECPSCGYSINQKNVVQEWPGLPAGVKFDPTDQELLEHLATKVGSSCSANIHPFIDEFIPTLDGEDGICYTHPEKLPGVRRDGSCTHYFHKPARAYTTGNRKRRKIQSELDDKTTCETRWHKTGKTRPIMENGMQLGCKKIMVLYVTVGKKEKPAKTNWVMHQYHLGVEEDEKDDELVVSKVFYQMQPRANVGSGQKTDEDNLEAAPADDVMEELLQSATKSDVPGFTKSQSPEETLLTPKVITPLNPFVGKQPRALLQAITEDADRLTSSFNGSSVYSREGTMGILDYFHEESKDPEIEKLSSFTEISQGFQSGKLGAVNKVLSSEVCHEAQNSQNDCLPLANHKSNNACYSGNREGISKVLSMDNLGSCSQNSQETLDTDSISLLCDENLPPDVASKKATKKSTRKGFHKTKLPLDSHFTLDDIPDEEAAKAYSSLENIVLDTPPDFLLENFMGSKMGLDSQSQSGFISSQDFNVLDFLRDSQSSTQN